jgi:glycosyltransferase involved in cell wall biosynthesis
MRIAQIIASTDLSWGGPSAVVRGLSAALVARGHAVTVFSTDAAPGGRRTSAPAGEGFDARVEQRRVRVDRSGPPYPSVALALTLGGSLSGFDVAHLHGLFSVPAMTALLASRLLRVPLVVRPCGMLDPWSLRHGGARKAWYWRHVEGPLVCGAAAIQASTRHEAEGVLGALAAACGPAGGPTAPKGRVASGPTAPPVVVAPQGVDAGAEASVAGAERAWPRRYVLFLGRVAAKKGLVPLVEALSRLDVADPPDLLVAGPDERGHAAEVRAAAVACGVAERVVLLGPVFEAEAKARLFAGASAFCLPSADENFGVALVEAARFGVPLLVSPAVGLADAVVAHGAGMVAEASAGALSAALARLLGSEGAGLVAGARRFAADFSWDVRIAAVEDLYRSAMARRGTA